ncbi:MAG: S1C family serine protease [Oligoflexales bacterium]
MRNILFIIVFMSLHIVVAPATEAKVLQSFASVAEKAFDGVVNIRSKTWIKQDHDRDIYQFFLQGRLPEKNQTVALGSGVIIDREGHIVTNYHVIQDASSIEVLFAKSRKKLEARVVGVDRKTDLALLKVLANQPLKPLSFGNSDKVRAGDWVLAIGNPLGYAHSLTSGIISAKGRVLGSGPYDDFLQTDAAINPGNSGGPLLDMRGRLIGINTAVEKQAYGIGFAIPIHMVQAVVRDLKAFGKVRRPFLGIVGRNILSRDEGANGGGVYGVIVRNLIVDGPAHKGKLQLGDLLMAMDEIPLRDMNILQRELIQKKTTDRVRLKIYRRGRGFLHVVVDLTEVPSSHDLPQQDNLF